MKKVILVCVLAACLAVLSACSACEHDFQQVSQVDASCGFTGSIRYVCNKCEEEMTETVPALQHRYDTGVVTAEATCTQEGTVTYTCGICDGTYTEAIPKTEHSYDQGVITTAATCTKEGVRTYTCKTCAGAYTEKIAKTAHSYDQGVITTAATCTKEGVRTYTCSICTGTYTEAVPKTAHSYAEEKVAPTCTEPGYTQSTCQTCGHKDARQEIQPNGHQWGTWEVTKLATYSEAGEHKHTCTVCGGVETRSLGKLVKTADSVWQEVLRLVNIEREKAGIAPMSYHSGAQIAADARAQDLILLFAHERPDGSVCFDVLDDYHVKYAYPLGENIAMGYSSAQSVMNGWMNSPGHRANILNPDFTHIVVGGVGGRWVQLFFG